MSRIVGRGLDPYSQASDVELQSGVHRSPSSISSTSSGSLAYTHSTDRPHQSLVAPHNDYTAYQNNSNNPHAQFPSYASGSTIVPYAYAPPPPPNYSATAHPPVAPGHAAYYDTSARQGEQIAPWYRRVPWLTTLVVTACTLVFIVTMGVNDCPGHAHSPGQSCVLTFLGRFSFEPLSVNPLFGPTAMTLQRMGALNSNLITGYHQAWRLLTAMWLHGGVVHLLFNLFALSFLLKRLESEFGLWRPALIYLLSGLFASVFSSLFLNTEVSVGASGALFGLVGACLSELMTNWGLYDNRVSALSTLLLLIALNLAIGLLPLIDNFAHIGGCLAGVVLGFVLLLKPQRGFIDLRDGQGVREATEIARAGGEPVTRKYTPCQWYTRIVAALLFLAMFTTAVAVLFSKGSVGADCDWCQYMTCVPTAWWSCDTTPENTQGGGPICQVRTYQNGTGALVCTNQTMSLVPNITSYSTPDLRVLCTETCTV